MPQSMGMQRIGVDWATEQQQWQWDIEMLFLYSSISSSAAFVLPLLSIKTFTSLQYA